MDPNYCLLILKWPCAPLDWWNSAAAWAQALLSAAAIYFSVQLAINQIYASERKRVQSMQKLVYHAWHSMHLVVQDAEALPTLKKPLTLATAPLQACLEALQAIQIDQLPSYRLYNPITFSRAHVRVAIDFVETLNRGISDGDLPTPEHVEILRTIEGELVSLREDMTEVELSYRPWIQRKIKNLSRRVG